MRVSPGRTGGFKSCAAQGGRLESLTRPQSFGHLKVTDRATAFLRANPQSRQPSVGPLTQSIRPPNESGHYFRELDSAAIVAPIELLTVLSPAFSIRQTRARRGGRV